MAHGQAHDSNDKKFKDKKYSRTCLIVTFLSWTMTWHPVPISTGIEFLDHHDHSSICLPASPTPLKNCLLTPVVTCASTSDTALSPRSIRITDDVPVGTTATVVALAKTLSCFHFTSHTKIVGLRLQSQAVKPSRLSESSRQGCPSQAVKVVRVKLSKLSESSHQGCPSQAVKVVWVKPSRLSESSCQGCPSQAVKVVRVKPSRLSESSHQDRGPRCQVPRDDNG